MATLDLSSDEWILHSPSIKAAKYWIGDLGRNATHAIVFAKMIIKEDSYGVQPFIVPVRDIKTHKPFDGIEVGDIGTKLAMKSLDNGFILFTNYRIPRKNLLSRFINVDREGNFEMKGDPKILYQGMVATRVSLLHSSYQCISKATVIATRYAVCRRQFKTLKGISEERKLLDY